MAVKHLVPTDRFPFTLCGVDITIKQGADWVADDEVSEDKSEVTCRNCVKLMTGGHMGALPPRPKTREEREAEADPREPFQERYNKIQTYRQKIRSMIQDVRVASGDASSNEEKAAWNEAVDFLDGAEFQLQMAAGEVREIIKALSPEVGEEVPHAG